MKVTTKTVMNVGQTKVTTSTIDESWEQHAEPIVEDYYQAATRERMSWALDATSVALCVFMPRKCPRSQQGQKLRTWWRKRFSTTIDRHPRAMARRAKVLATDRMAHGKEAEKRLQWKELQQDRQVEVLC